MLPTPYIARACPLKKRRVICPGLSFSSYLHSAGKVHAFVACHGTGLQKPQHRVAEVRTYSRAGQAKRSLAVYPAGNKIRKLDVQSAQDKLTCTILNLPSTSPLAHQMRTAINPMWTNATWLSRARLWGRLELFCRERGVPPDPIHAVLFLQQMDLAPATLLSYTRNLQTVFQLSQTDPTPLEMFAKALQARGALEPTRQMEPITPWQLRRLRTKLSLSEGIAALICWKAAARWTEVAELTLERFVRNQPNEVIVYWGRNTKSKSTPRGLHETYK